MNWHYLIFGVMHGELVVACYDVSFTRKIEFPDISLLINSRN